MRVLHSRHDHEGKDALAEQARSDAGPTGDCGLVRAVCVCLAAMMLAGCGGHARSLVRSCGDLGKSVRRGDRDKIDEGVLPATRSRVDYEALLEDSANWGERLGEPTTLPTDFVPLLGGECRFPPTVSRHFEIEHHARLAECAGHARSERTKTLLERIGGFRGKRVEDERDAEAEHLLGEGRSPSAERAVVVRQVLLTGEASMDAPQRCMLRGGDLHTEEVAFSGALRRPRRLHP